MELERFKRELDEHGLCVIPNALEAAMLAAVQGRLIEQAQAEAALNIKADNYAHMDEHNQWVNMLLNKGAIFADLVQHPAALALAEHLLGKDFVLSCCDAQIKHPGSRAMKLHSDQWWLPKPVRADEKDLKSSEPARHLGSSLAPEKATGLICPPVVLVVMWVITDFSEAGGATRVVADSHVSGVEPDPSVPHKAQSDPVVAPAGSLLALDGRTWHGSGDNVSRASRYAITCNYCAPQFRAMENYTRALRPEVASNASPKLLQLLGYNAWDVYGHTGDPARRAVDASEALGELRVG